MSSTPDTSLVFGLLGPAGVWHDGHELDLGSPQQRALFALLLLHRNEVVSTDRLRDALWPEELPPNALQVLRTYVSRLRSGPLGSAAVSPLRTHRHGYELCAAAHAVDADRFESLVAAGRGELESGDAIAAEALLREALGLVRGTALPELLDDLAAGAERERLEELRGIAEEELAEALLVQGRHRELLPELRATVSARRFRERSWGQLMVALYRSGRQTEALDAYREARRALAGELGLEPGRELRALERMILVHDEALEPPSARERWVPPYGTSFIGRDAERTAVRERLLDGRLVTLIGPGGVGKTRLAAEIAPALADALGARLWWIDLGSVSPGHVVATVARMLAVPEIAGRAPLDLLVTRLEDEPALLVLDNCEHVLEEVERLAGRILAGARSARILCTSRAALGLAAELIQPVAGLGTPTPGTLPADLIAVYPAVRLLLERAARPHMLSRTEASAVAEVVTRLDGLPLAIELAATKLRSLPAEELARSLRARLSLLENPKRAAPARQRSLESAIAWSYDLVPEAERVVLRRLAVFPGGFDAAAAEAVAGGGGLAPAAVLPALANLVQASLLVAEHERAATRYRLLQTVRVFAGDRLREADEHDGAARRHRDAYLGLAEAVARNMRGAGLPTWLPRARQEHENFQAALRWSFERGDAAEALQLAAQLWWYWFRVGNVAEGRELLEEALRAASPTSPFRHLALLGRAFMAHAAGSPDALPVAQASVAACAASGDGWSLGYALGMEAHALTAQGLLEEALAGIARARSLFDATGDEEGVAFADQVLGGAHLRAGRLDAAERLLLSARDRFRRLRGELDAGYTLLDLARVTQAQQRSPDAIEHATQALADFRRRGDPRGVSGALICLGWAHSLTGEEERARALLDEALTLARRWGYPALAAEAESVLARLDVGGEEPELGALVEALGAEHVAGFPVVGQQRDGDVRVAEELR